MKDTIKTDKASVRNFALVFSLIIALLCALFFWKKHTYNVYFLSLSALFLFLAVIWPMSLKYFYIGWMKLAKAIAAFNTVVILSVIYYVFFTLTGLVLKIFNHDLLEQKFNKNALSYWVSIPVKVRTQEDYESLS